MTCLSLIGLITQFFASFISLLYYKHHRTKFAFFLCLILMINVLCELIGVYYKYIGGNSYNLYFIYTFFVFNLITVKYLEIVKSQLLRNLIILCNVFFILFSFFVFYKKSMFPYLIMLGGVNTSLNAFFYLKELLLSNEIINYKSLLPFWVSVGMLVFYLPSIPFFASLNYMKNRDLFFILDILIILMNLFIIYGLITCNKEEKF